MTVREFIEWLKTQDQDATVTVVNHTSGTGYYDQGGNATVVPFDPSNDRLFYHNDSRHLFPEGHYARCNELLLGQHDG